MTAPHRAITLPKTHLPRRHASGFTQKRRPPSLPPLMSHEDRQRLIHAPISILMHGRTFLQAGASPLRRETEDFQRRIDNGEQPWWSHRPFALGGGGDL